MNIKAHKGIQADQSHNYMLDLTRGELKFVFEGLGCFLDQIEEYSADGDGNDGKDEEYERIQNMREAMRKYIEA